MPRLVHPPKPREKLERRFITVNQYCDARGISRAAAYSGMRSGKIPYEESDGCRRIPARYLDELEEQAYARLDGAAE